MTLLEGQILRFKGRSAKRFVAEAEAELSGRCERKGDTLIITQRAHLPLKYSASSSVEPTAQRESRVPKLSLEPGVLGDNGHREAKRTEDSGQRTA